MELENAAPECKGGKRRSDRKMQDQYAKVANAGQSSIESLFANKNI